MTAGEHSPLSGYRNVVWIYLRHAAYHPMIVSVTRLRLRSILYLPGFFGYAIPSQRDSARAQGFVDGRLIPEGMRIFWTITRWNSEAEMRAWRGSGAHGTSMSKLAGWCDEASVAR